MGEESLGLLSSIGSNMSEEEMEENSVICEQQVYEREDVLEIIGVDLRPQKRIRADGSEEDVNDGDNSDFTLVQKKAKRFARSTSDNSESGLNQNKSEKNKNILEVCLTSTQLLPKQIGFAKMMKEQNIRNIIHIKYKSPYKVLLKFETKGDANTLLRCEKFAEEGYRCHLTNEVDISYGIVKYLELEVEEKELEKSITCEYKIESVKRLKRLSEKGEWIDSETVRFGFKSSIVPAYVYGYDCRFKVDPYIFPVTQCSFCWRYGHVARACPTKKTMCPKCGEGHANCEVDSYRCINCRGDHMSFDKKCPVFLKEKEVRIIMSQDYCKCTYKMALSNYYKNKRSSELPLHNDPRNLEVAPSGPAATQTARTTGRSQEKSYRDVILAGKRQEAESETVASLPESEQDTRDNDLESNTWENLNLETGWEQPRGKAKRKKKGKTQSSSKVSEKAAQKLKKSGVSTMFTPKEDESASQQHPFKEFLRKSKNIIFSSERSLEEKFSCVLKLCIEEVMTLIVKSVSSGGLIKNLIDLFHNG